MKRYISAIVLSVASVVATSVPAMAGTEIPVSVQKFVEKSSHLPTWNQAGWDSLTQEQQYEQATYYSSSAFIRDLESALLETEGREVRVARPFFSLESTPVNEESRALEAGTLKRRVGWDKKFVAVIWNGKVSQVMEYYYRGATIKRVEFCNTESDGFGPASASAQTNFGRRADDIKLAFCESSWSFNTVMGGIGKRMRMEVNNRGMVSSSWS